MAQGPILGVSNLDVRSHDNAACLLSDGELIAHAEEERFTRNKHAYDSLPLNSVRYCLEKAGMEPGDIGRIAIGWDLPRTSFDHQGNPALRDDHVTVAKKVLSMNKDTSQVPSVEYVSHHLAHAALSYYASGFKRAAIMIVDGAGETEATTMWKGHDQTLTKLHTKDQSPHSLGYMYEGVSEYLGFRGNEPGKVMGLAAYHTNSSEPFGALRFNEIGYSVEFPRDILEKVTREYSRKKNYLIMDYIKECWMRYCETLFGPRNQFFMQTLQRSDVHFETRASIASVLQTSLERCLLSSASFLQQQTRVNDLCLGGGVALNCSANGALDQSGIFKNIYIHPASNDAGVALGAALYAHNESGTPSFDAEQIRDNPYWGPEYTDDEIAGFLDDAGLSYSECKNDFSDASDLIASGKILAWFQGRMEIGPRALGGRSILADPRDPTVHERVNLIKGRELWRPLAPSVLRGYEKWYFEPGVFSPFMLRSAKVKDEMRNSIPAVTHFDGSSRYQSVSAETNPRFSTLIESFRSKTGIPMVLNTSFNYNEPIVCTPQDALRTFMAREIDHLVIGKFLLNKSS